MGQVKISRFLVYVFVFVVELFEFRVDRFKGNGQNNYLSTWTRGSREGKIMHNVLKIKLWYETSFAIGEILNNTWWFQGEAKQKATDIFHHLDVNGDGDLSLKEFVHGCLKDKELVGHLKKKPKPPPKVTKDKPPDVCVVLVEDMDPSPLDQEFGTAWKYLNSKWIFLIVAADFSIIFLPYFIYSSISFNKFIVVYPRLVFPSAPIFPGPWRLARGCVRYRDNYPSYRRTAEHIWRSVHLTD